MASLSPLINRFRQLWSRLGRGQQMALIGVSGGALVFAFIFVNMGSKPVYVTAFTNLDPKDSAAVVEQLQADGIAYEVTPDGSTIKVAPAKLADARLKLAAKGLPQGGSVGFELFDKTSFGVTDFVQQINYQRALEGELSRTINTLAPIEGSRVHIVVPKQELFSSQQKPATASVVLRLRAGRNIDEGMLKGISYLVARSVQGLDGKYITILDSTGRMLFDGGSDNAGVAGLSATQMDVQQKLEQGLEAQAQTLLDRIAGPNRAAVRVKADMDFSQQEELSETYTQGGPNGQSVVRSSSSVTESFNGQGGGGAAVPGANANLPGNTPGQNAANNGANQYTRTETTTNNEVSKTTQRTTRSPGQLKRLSVSVVLDSSIPETDAIGLRDAVAAAVGIDQKRGDALVVTTAAFSEAGVTDIPPAAAPPSPADAITKYAAVGVPAVAALMVLFVVWRMSRSVSPKKVKEKKTKITAISGEGQLALAGAGAGSGLLPAGEEPRGLLEAGDKKSYLDMPWKQQENPELVRRRQEIQERMTTLATSNPEAVVEIIHSWMSQDDNGKRR